MADDCGGGLGCGGIVVPKITGFSPAVVVPGQSVRIVGTGFKTLGAVYDIHFGAVPAGRWTVSSDTVITAEVGACHDASTGQVVVIVKTREGIYLMNLSEATVTVNPLPTAGVVAATVSIPPTFNAVKPETACQDTWVRAEGGNFRSPPVYKVILSQPDRVVEITSIVIEDDSHLRFKIPRHLPNGTYRARLWNASGAQVAGVPIGSDEINLTVKFKPTLSIKAGRPLVTKHPTATVDGTLAAAAVRVIAVPAADGIEFSSRLLTAGPVGDAIALFGSGLLLGEYLGGLDKSVVGGASLGDTQFPGITTPVPLVRPPAGAVAPYGFRHTGRAKVTWKAGGQTFTQTVAYDEPLGKAEQLEAVRKADRVETSGCVEWALIAPSWNAGRNEIVARMILHRRTTGCVILTGEGFLTLLRGGVPVSRHQFAFGPGLPDTPESSGSLFPWILDLSVWKSAAISLAPGPPWTLEAQFAGTYVKLGTPFEVLPYTFGPAVVPGFVDTNKAVAGLPSGFTTNTGAPCGTFGVPPSLC